MSGPVDTGHEIQHGRQVCMHHSHSRRPIRGNAHHCTLAELDPGFPHVSFVICAARSNDEAELLRRIPDAMIERVAQAGHSVQYDRPMETAVILEAFIRRFHEGAAATHG